MDLGIKTFFMIIMILISMLILTGMLVVNLNSHHATNVTVRVVDLIHEENGLSTDVQTQIDTLATENDVIIEVVEYTVNTNDATGKKYLVRTKFDGEIIMLGFQKLFTKEKYTRVLYQ